MTLKRIIIHWTAGGPAASTLDMDHYHFIVQQDGKVVQGKMKPEDNASTGDGKYAAHTLNCNTGSIGVALAGMAGAVEAPFAAGPYPIKQPQVAILCSLVAKLCRQYGIPVTRQTVLSHAEVQPTLGIKQRGKWDVAWLPGFPKPIDPVSVGDRLRGDILEALNLQKGPTP
jgi:N-acetyl-anhydromuramyl-L-alanine amidase AmpD